MTPKIQALYDIYINPSDVPLWSDVVYSHTVNHISFGHIHIFHSGDDDSQDIQIHDVDIDNTITLKEK